jgi:hypothetical protein
MWTRALRGGRGEEVHLLNCVLCRNLIRYLFKRHLNSFNGKMINLYGTVSQMRISWGNRFQCHFIHHESHMTLDRTRGHYGGNPATNRLSGSTLPFFQRTAGFVFHEAAWQQWTQSHVHTYQPVPLSRFSATLKPNRGPRVPSDTLRIRIEYSCWLD